jgi:hypothetical protein
MLLERLLLASHYSWYIAIERHCYDPKQPRDQHSRLVKRGSRWDSRDELGILSLPNANRDHMMLWLKKEFEKDLLHVAPFRGMYFEHIRNAFRMH